MSNNKKLNQYLLKKKIKKATLLVGCTLIVTGALLSPASKHRTPGKEGPTAFWHYKTENRSWAFAGFIAIGIPFLIVGWKI